MTVTCTLTLDAEPLLASLAGHAFSEITSKTREGFLSLLETAEQAVSLEFDVRAAPGATETVVALYPSDSLLVFMTAAAALDWDGLIVKESGHDISPSR